MSSLPPPAPRALEIPAAILDGVELDVRDLPDGSRILVVGPFALAIPLDDTNARTIGERLADRPSSIVVPAASLIVPS